MTGTDQTEDKWGPVELHTDRPHSARIYDYILGGKTHFPADRVAAERALDASPNIRTAMRLNRDFLRRSVHWLATEAGIRQFLDIGTGIPATGNTHEVAQAAAPDARVVYVDNDPIVLAHARALLESTPEGRTAYIEADAREPEKILADPRLAATLELTEPVALTMMGILQFLTDEDGAREHVARLLDVLPSGSYLAFTQVTDLNPDTADVARSYAAQGIPFQVRSRAETEAFLKGLEPVSPGLVLMHHWRPDNPSATANIPDEAISVLGVVARKP